jgi:hypothetical protein
MKGAKRMGVIGRAMTREEEAEMVAQHRKGCELARAGQELPAGAHIAMSSGYQGELKRMEEERKRVADRIDGFDRDDLGESPDY